MSLMLGTWYATGTATILVITVGCGALLLLAWFCTHSYRTTTLVLFLLCGAFFLGARLYTQQQCNFTASGKIFNKKQYDIIARVTDIKTTDTGRHPHIVQLQLHKLKEPSRIAKWHQDNSVIVAYCYRITQLQPDDLIYIEKCNFTHQKPNSSFNDYLIKEGVTATLFCSSLQYTLLQRPRFSLNRTLFTLKTNLFNRIAHKMSRPVASFFGSLFLGNRHTYKSYIKQMKSHFCIWGLAHFLARSGLHLILFIFLWQLMLAKVPLPARYKYLILLVLTCIYTLLSWSSLSFLRAFATFCMYQLAALSNQQVSTVHMVTLLALATIIYNPIQLFFLDFQLSFGLTFALAWIYQTYNWHRLATSTNP